MRGRIWGAAEGSGRGVVSCRWGSWKDQEGVLRPFGVGVPEKRVKESDFCRMRSPDCSSGVSEARSPAQGKGGACSPQALLLHPWAAVRDALGMASRRWGPGSWFPGEVLAPGTGRPPWVPLPTLLLVAVWVRVPFGIRELLAAPTEILLLTANARRGCFHGNTGQGGQLVLRCCGLCSWKPRSPPSSPFLVLGPSVLCNAEGDGVVWCSGIGWLRDLGS